MSQRPGTRNFPVAATISAPSGMLTSARLPIAAMRPPSITTVMPAEGGAPVASRTVTSVRTSAFVGRGASRGAVAFGAAHDSVSAARAKARTRKERR
jgi:hypothetical protein